LLSKILISGPESHAQESALITILVEPAKTIVKIKIQILGLKVC
jgi:hypothetical protein